MTNKSAFPEKKLEISGNAEILYLLITKQREIRKSAEIYKVEEGMNTIRAKHVDFEKRANPENFVDKVLWFAHEALRLLEGLKPIIIEISAILLSLVGVITIVAKVLSMKFGG